MKIDGWVNDFGEKEPDYKKRKKQKKKRNLPKFENLSKFSIIKIVVAVLLAVSYTHLTLPTTPYV